jgi:hypothetical protein
LKVRYKGEMHITWLCSDLFTSNDSHFSNINRKSCKIIFAVLVEGGISFLFATLTLSKTRRYWDGVCAILLRLYTSAEHLKRVYTSPGPFLEIYYFR